MVHSGEGKMAESHRKKPHAIMISFHLQGHIIPFVNLALKLASKGFSITFVHTEIIHQQICKAQGKEPSEVDIFTEARDSGLDISYTTISDGFPLDFDRTANFDLTLHSFLHDYPYVVDEFVGKILRSHSSAINFIVADTLAVWPAKIAEKYNLVNVSFWTEPALVFNLYYHLELLKQNGHFLAGDIDASIKYVPGIQEINTKDLMSYLQEPESNLIPTIMFKAFDEVKRANFILCNTVAELEAETISALRKKQPFFAVGPLFSPDFAKALVAGSLLKESDCTEWLKTKAPGSVLYVSFGSLAKTEKDVIQEIAKGLLLSEVNFIWVLRPGIVNSDDDNEILPPGFVNNVKGRGLIVPWCTQTSVLSNPAIGGFLTHCGWNSILESVWCGVPMICYPLFTDQITNRKIVVDDWKIGINLCDGIRITALEVAEKIKSLISRKSLADLRHRLEEVEMTLRKALQKDGSSERNFDEFVENLRKELDKKNQESI